MSLATLGGKLLVVGGRLAMSIACCCSRWCRQIGVDPCGNSIYGCGSQQAGSIGPCTAACVPPESPCECGPDVPCPGCYKCVDRKCERIDNCCVDGPDCPECSKCVGGECLPCGLCEQCIDGECLPCGPCQKCEDGDCVACGPEEVCIGGACVPKDYYCCWESCEDKRLNTNNTQCVEATVSGSSQSSPCGEGSEDGYGPCDLTKGGPYTGLQKCEPNCQKYQCVPDACGNNQCVPSNSGVYSTLDECEEACDDPCLRPCAFSPANAQGVYYVDGCERDICVSYSSLNSRPIRVQIWGPIMEDGCPVPGSRVIKTDSDWRGDECCDCLSARPPGNLEGGPKGQITWEKPRGVTAFEVVVLNPCGANVALDVQACTECADLPEPEGCPCVGDCDANEGCHCCCDKCQQDPCKDNCDEFANWTIEASFCGETLVWSSDPANNNSPIGWRLNFNKPADSGACCWFGLGDPCEENGGGRRTGPAGGVICTGGGGIGFNCGMQMPDLWLDGNCDSDTAGKCVGSIGILAVGPPGDCTATSCIRYYQADIVDGELVNIRRNEGVAMPLTACACDDTIEVTLTYFPAP